MAWGEAYNQSKESLANLSSQAINLGMQKKQMDVQKQQWEEQQEQGKDNMIWDIIKTGLGVFVSIVTANPLPAIGAAASNVDWTNLLNARGE